MPPPAGERMGYAEAVFHLLRLMGRKWVTEEEVRALFVGARRLVARRTQRARYYARKHAAEAGTAGTDGTVGNPPFVTPNPIAPASPAPKSPPPFVEAARAFLDAVEKGEWHE